MRPRRTANVRRANNFRCSGSRSRSRTTSTSTGVPTRFGTGGYVPMAHQDAEVVRRLRAAGAVIVGKTNTCELGQWPFTSGPAFGHTRNPWSSEHTPGGSSGGSAAAVAAGLVAAAIGSDGAGSVRIPAAWTHLVGIKPQRGRISTWPLPEAFNGITVNGVLARTVTDAALVLDAASGNVPGDLHQPPPVRVSDFVAQAPGPLKIAMSTKFPYTVFRAKLHPEIRAAMETVAGQLEELGHTIVAADPDYNLRDVVELPVPVDVGAARLGGSPRPERQRWTNARWPIPGPAGCCRRTRCARPAPAKPNRSGGIGWIFNLVDVVLAPTTAQPPPRVTDFDHRGGLSTDRAMIRACPVTWPWNLLGWPSINVPAGFTYGGLPIGVQLMGPANSEPLLISLAAELEALNGWVMRQPDVWWDRGERAPAPELVPRPPWRILPLRSRFPTRSRNLPNVTVSDVARRGLRALPVVAVVGAARRGHARRQRRQQAAQRRRGRQRLHDPASGRLHQRREDQPEAAAGGASGTPTTC